MKVGELHHKQVELRCSGDHAWAATVVAEVVATINMPNGDEVGVYEHRSIEPKQCPRCGISWTRCASSGDYKAISQ